MDSIQKSEVIAMLSNAKEKVAFWNAEVSKLEDFLEFFNRSSNTKGEKKDWILKKDVENYLKLKRNEKAYGRIALLKRTIRAEGNPVSLERFHKGISEFGDTTTYYSLYSYLCSSNTEDKHNLINTGNAFFDIKKPN